MTLSKRLSLIGSMVRSGSRVCDVGTDHGYLPAFLYKSGKCESVCATDIKEKPLLSARKNLAAAGAEGVELYLCDGLDKITREMADTVIIAGMGGEVISGIIARADFLRDNTVTLILQPTTSADKLREFLAANGFAVLCEKAISENGKLYSVIQCAFCETRYPIDGVRKYIGFIKPDYEDGRAYIEKQYRIIEKRVEELENAGMNDYRQREDKETLAKLKKLLGEGEKNGV